MQISTTVIVVTVLLIFSLKIRLLSAFIPAVKSKLNRRCRHSRCNKQAVGGRPPRYAPAPLLPAWAPKRLAPPSRRQRSSTVTYHGQHVLTPTVAAAWRANTAVSKAARRPWPLTFWPWKWCPSHVWRTWATSVPISVFLGLSVLDLGPIYATDRHVRHTDVRQHHRLMRPPIRGESIIKRYYIQGPLH